VSDPDEPTRVGIGVIRRGDEFLIRQRPPLPGSPMPGFWEFPGGKCHAGETPQQCTVRECAEEVGLPIVAVRLRRVVRHRYPHGYVELHFFDCRTADPDSHPEPATGFRWVELWDLPKHTFPGANDTIIADLLAERVRPASHNSG